MAKVTFLARWALLANLATLIRYNDGRQQLQGKAAKTLADAISEREVD